MRKTSHTTVIISSIAIIFAASIALYFVAEKKVREDLLAEAKTFAQEIDFTQVNTLSGTRADLETESYIKIKAQLIEMQSRNESIAFVYLAGIRDILYREKADTIQEDMEIFFYLDGEPGDSYDVSLPGDIYDSASQWLFTAFETGEAFVYGPESDQWGTWVTGVVMYGNNTPNERILFGLDYAAKTYYENIFLYLLKLMALPILLVILGLVFYYRRKK